MAPYNQIQQIKKEWEEIRVKHSGDPEGMVKATTYLVEENSVDNFKVKSEIMEYIKLLKITITGNGDPTNSLIARLEASECALKLISNKIEILTHAITGDMTGDNGIKTQIQNLDNIIKNQDNTIKQLNKKINNIKNGSWAIILIVLGQVIALLLNLL